MALSMIRGCECAVASLTMEQDILYYDGNCPLCSYEMAHLRQWGDGSLRLVDIHTEELESDVPDKESLLGVLHLRTRDGSWLKGLDASVRAWQSTRIGWLWKLFRLPLIAPLADAVYFAWAKRRYRKLYSRDCPAKQKVQAGGDH